MNRRAGLFLIALTVALIPRGARAAGSTTIGWCGHKWIVRNDTGGPGPNTFSSKNVSLSSDGALHLSIIKRASRWTCAEVYTTETLGDGTYEFSVETRVDDLDQNITFGMFSYPPASVGPDGTNEMDIEFSRWGNASYPIGNFTVWPTILNQPTASYTFDFGLHKAGTTNRYVWSPGSVTFESFRGFNHDPANRIAQWTTPESFSKFVSTQAMPVHINLWLFQSQAPSNGQPVEVILKSFSFKKRS